MAPDSMSARSKLFAEDVRDRVDGSHERVAQEMPLYPSRHLALPLSRSEAPSVMATSWRRHNIPRT